MESFELALDSETNKKLDALAERLNIPKAELIQQGINLVLQKYEDIGNDALLKIVGIGAGKPGNISEEHDRYIADMKLARRRV